MANTKSAIKADRKSNRLHDRNLAVRTRLKTLRKKFQQAAASGDATSARDAATALIAAMDKATKSGVVHRNAAIRVKSQASKFVFAK